MDAIANSMLETLKRLEAHLSIYTGPDPAVHACALRDVRQAITKADPAYAAEIGL